ncbi:MAG TPA: DinB family protein [Pyrinomonadaceae bacterium]|nr:DinB family protein [Pyrinomonadaceae bacterium]
MTDLNFQARPDTSEYAPYYEKYIILVPEGDVVATLTGQLDDTLTFLRGLSEDQADSRYAPDKWSIKEVVGHVIDTERIFGQRAFRFARNDQTPLPGFDQDEYVQSANFGERKLSDIADELEYVRRANLCLLRSLDDTAWQRRGLANDNEVSVRALVYIIAGHETHHMQIIRTKYL